MGFRATGHTGYAEEGSDIVCSAVSVLTQAAANGLTDVLKLSAAVQQAEGELYVMLEKGVTGGELEKAGIIFQTMVLALNDLARTYGDYIKMIEREV